MAIAYDTCIFSRGPKSLMANTDIQITRLERTFTPVGVSVSNKQWPAVLINRSDLGMDVSGGCRQVRWKAWGQPSQHISSPPSLHTAHSSSLQWAWTHKHICSHKSKHTHTQGRGIGWQWLGMNGFLRPLPCRCLSPSCGWKWSSQVWTRMAHLSPLMEHKNNNPLRL